MAFNRIIHERITSWTIVMTLMCFCISENSFPFVNAITPTSSPSSSKSSDTHHVTKKPWVIGVNILRTPSAPATYIASNKAQTTHSQRHNKETDKENYLNVIDNVSKSHILAKAQEEVNGEKMPYDEVANKSIDTLIENGSAYGARDYETAESLLKKLINSKPDMKNNLDLDVIIQAFRFVKLDLHLTSLVSQLDKLQRSHENLQSQTVKQDTKFELVLNEIKSLVNSVTGESAKVKGAEERIQTEMEKMNHRLDQAVEKIIKSSATSEMMLDLSKEGLQQMSKIEGISNEVLNKVTAVKTELGDVGQVSIQAIYNIHKLEENLMVGLAEIGNQTIYALRQEAKIIGPTALLENGNEGSSIQADGSNPGGFISSVKKVAILVGDGGGGGSSGGGRSTKAESLVSCLSRKRLINERRPRDCGEIQLLGHSQNGIYTIFPSIRSDHPQPTEVYCDLMTKGGGWTVIQRRTDDKAVRENFYRTWQDYEKGFGSPVNQYWIGLENMAAITESGDQELKIELTDWNRGFREANYAYFRVSNNTNKFRLHLADYSGNAGDSLAYHNGMAFSTKDQDNDLEKASNCADRYQGAWWYKNCHQSNLNGVFMDNNRGKHESYAMGIAWYTWHGYYYSLRRVEMKIRNRHFLQLLE